MRISELSRVTGQPVATIKYYLREGLIPRGEHTAPNQADYDHGHVHRLRLVRVLREVGGLSIDEVREVVQAVDDRRLSRHEVLGVANRALSPSDSPGGTRELGEVDALLRRLGWEASPDAPGRHELARALASLRGLGRNVGVEAFAPYAEAIEPIASAEVAGMRTDMSRDEAVEYTVVGAVVYERVLCALRRLAHEHHSARSR